MRVMVLLKSSPETESGQMPTEQELAEWCRTRLAPFKQPRFVLFADALPRTPTHRIAKFELRKDATLKQRAVDLNERIPRAP